MAQEVSILPVFNQAATNVWRDFFNIRKACMSAIYNYNLQKSDCENEIKEYKYNWEKKNFNFAFAAYIHNRMVGFIQGDSSMNTAYIRNLYVRPEYTLKRIGYKLLQRSEQACALFASDMELISLVRAQPFYEKYGFRPLLAGQNYYAKAIQWRPSCVILPVFYISEKIESACNKLAKSYGETFNKENVESLHIPMFVYLDENSDISGFITGELDTKKKICKISQICMDKNKSYFTKQRLIKEFNSMVY